jgi:diacylglycerol O-acyltransferase / wax synthase
MSTRRFDATVENEDRLLVPTTVFVGLALVGIVGSRLLYSLTNHHSKGGRRERRPRSFSYTSNAMVAGSFPPSSLMPETIINAVAWFEECPDAEELAEQVVTPMLAYTRLNSIPDASTSRTRPASQHYRPIDLVRVKQEGGESSIYQEIFRHLQDPLTKDRSDLPWWEVLVIRQPNKASGKSRAAVVFRIHHGLADGISLVNVFGDILKYQDGSPVVSLLQNFTSHAKAISKPKRRRGLFREVWIWVRELFNVLTLGMTRYDDDTAYSKHNHSRMTYSGHRRAVVFPTVPLDFIKALKNAASVTINDVLMAAISQAISDYCAHHRCPVLATERPGKRKILCRALLPVAFPRPAEHMKDTDAALSNKWCFFSTDLGLGVPDMLDRLQFIHTNNLDIKATPRVLLQLGIQNKLLPYLPAVIGQQTLFDIMSRHSLVFSNVPGPDRHVLIAGKVVTGVQMLYANLIPQVGFLSYAGNVYGNIMLDPTTLEDSDRLAHLYVDALRAMAARLSVPVPRELSGSSTDPS